jgi:glycosyltransferase involved in cell wall biosynthesis
MKKVLFINNISSVSFYIGEELKKKGWDYEIFTPYRNYIVWSSGKTIVPKNKLSNYLLSDVNFKEFDMIHYNYPALLNSVTARFKTLLYKKNFILHFHGSDLRWNGFSYFFRTLSSFKVHSVFYATPDLFYHLNFFKKRKTFLPNPIKPLKKIDCKEYDNKILVFSRLEKEKGLRNLIPIIKELKDYEFHFIDWVFDDGALKKELPKNTKIIPKHPHDKINELLSKYKIILGQYSPYGVFGLSELESMSMGKPTFFKWNKKFNSFYSSQVPVLEYNKENIIALMENKKERKKLGMKQKRWVFKRAQHKENNKNCFK